MDREIGGYFEFERFAGRPYHADAIQLNSGRGCLSYLVELRGINRIWLPDFMCDSVYDVFERSDVRIETYPVDASFRPDYDAFAVQDGAWLLLMDYYGQLQSEDVEIALKACGGNLIVDETQGFFREPWKDADTTYTCRKWFGVSDGAYLCTKDGACLSRPLDRDESHSRMGFVLGRFEGSAEEFYPAAASNNDFFAGEDAKLMSALTENLMRAIDYRSVIMKRNQNWRILEKSLSSTNKLALRMPEGAFMYPFLTSHGKEIRSFMAQNRIYVPQLWPGVENAKRSSENARTYAADIVPLPVDQRYGAEEMERVLRVLEKALRETV